MEPITLKAGEHADLIVNGHTVRVFVDTNVGGDQFIQLRGIDCDLEGEEPGLYYPVARARSAT